MTTKLNRLPKGDNREEDGKINILDHIDRFKTYKNKVGCAWGSLHIVLSDLNVSCGNIKFCEQYALENGDTEGAELARILWKMSKTQQ